MPSFHCKFAEEWQQSLAVPPNSLIIIVQLEYLMYFTIMGTQRVSMRIAIDYNTYVHASVPGSCEFAVSPWKHIRCFPTCINADLFKDDRIFEIACSCTYVIRSEAALISSICVQNVPE